MMVSKKDYYEAYRLKVLGENELVHQRMSWFIPLQSFLFISFALFSNGDAFGTFRFLIFWGFCIVGMVSAIATYFSVESAFAAIQNTVERWQKTHLPDEELQKLPPLTGGEPGARTAGKGRMFAMSFPLVVATFWLIVGVLAALQI